jgi:hypothetical protein
MNTRFKNIFFISYLSLLLLFFSCKSDSNTSVTNTTLFAVKIGDNWGFVDSTCNFHQELVYQMADEFYLGRAIVQKNNKYSFVDQTGKTLHPFKFSKLTHFSDDSLAFMLDEKNIISCIDWNFKIVFSLQDAEEIHNYHNGIAAVRKNNKYGFVNKKGEIIINNEFDAVGKFSENLIAVAKYEDLPDTSYLKWFFIDRTGKQIFDMSFTDVHDFSEGFAAVAINGKWGWMNKSGKFVFGNDFQECKSFSEGYAAFKKGDAWGLINNKGKIVAQPNYFDVGEMHEHFATFSMGPKNVGYIDTTGNIVIQPQFESASNFNKGIAYVAKNNQIGLMRKNGTFFCDSKFDSAPNYWGEFLYLQLNEQIEITVDTVQVNP